MTRPIVSAMNVYDIQMTVKIKRLTADAKIPRYAHGPEEDAGVDLCSVEHAELEPGAVCAVATGLSIELPPGYEAQIRPRSGLALRSAITVANAPGTIDPAYRGEIKVILINLGRETYIVQPGDRIAQMVVARYESIEWEESALSDTTRGAGGFGSSGR